ncbi:hypothetical protein AB1N83_004545 [Pleurotus pulmonarius]
MTVCDGRALPISIRVGGNDCSFGRYCYPPISIASLHTLPPPLRNFWMTWDTAFPQRVQIRGVSTYFLRRLRTGPLSK